MLDKIFSDREADEIKLRVLVIYNPRSYRVKEIFSNKRWQRIEGRENLIPITQRQMDDFCRVYGWVQDQPSRVPGSMFDFLYTFSRPAGQVAFSLHSRAVEQNLSRHLRVMAECDYGVVAPPVLSTDWKSAKEAIAYGVRCGAFMNEDESRKEYFSMRDRIRPTKPAHIFKPWLELCQDLVEENRYNMRDLDTKEIMF